MLARVPDQHAKCSAHVLGHFSWLHGLYLILSEASYIKGYIGNSSLDGVVVDRVLSCECEVILVLGIFILFGSPGLGAQDTPVLCLL